MISITEIVLIVAGFAAIILGYLLPAGKEMDEEDKMLMEREIRELVRREVEDQKETIETMVDDTVDNSIDRTERAMERLSNEKMSAIGEYSDTVINDNKTDFLSVRKYVVSMALNLISNALLG